MKYPTFYPDRATLDRISPLADKLDKSASLDALWVTGTKASAEIPAFDKITRLLLPDRKSKSLAYYQAAMLDPRDLAAEIRQTTRTAKRFSVPVRWTTEFLGYSMTIGNARGENSWLQIEIAFPAIHGGSRPSFEFDRKCHDATIRQAFDVFDALWKNQELTREPNEDEYSNGAR